MNKKGFTLIEIIGSIIILGIISIIAYNAYTSSLRGFREDYYNDLTRTLQESGKEFFNDNRKYKPNGILEAQKVTLNGLMTEKYLDEVVDYNGDACNINSSYVLILKEGRDKYTYHTCLICSEDNFDNTTTDKYCDPAWLDPTKIGYDIGINLEPIYIYKGTERSKLRDLLKLPLSIVRYDYNGQKIASVETEAKDGLEMLYPVDIDIIDINKEATYKVTYEYTPPKPNNEGVIKKGSEPRNVIVYENTAPEISIRYENKRADANFTLNQLGLTNKTGSGSVKTESGAYVTNTWAQKIIITINSDTILQDPTETILKYQWRRNNKWQDLCTGSEIHDGYCETELLNDVDDEISFRMISSEGKISKETEPIRVKRDYTPPVCELSLEGTLGQRNGSSTGWYTTDVKITFNNKQDLPADSTSPVSEIKINNIHLDSDNVDRTLSNELNTQNRDVESATYKGFVEDNAGNFVTCSKTIKRDATKPECTLELSGTKRTDDPNTYVSKVVVTAQANDNLSGVYQYGINGDMNKHTDTQTTNGESITYNGIVEDNAGNTNTCNVVFKKNSNILLTLDLNGGNAWTNSTCTGSGINFSSPACIKTVTYDELYGTLPIPLRDGYSFEGWYLGTTLITSSAKVDLTENKILTAKWNANRFVITLDNNGATAPGSTTTYASYNSRTLDPITVPQRAYAIKCDVNGTGATLSNWNDIIFTYSFNGWYISGSGGQETMIADNNSTPQLLNVSGYTDGEGKWNRNSGATFTAKWSSEAVSLPTITKSGYRCAWYNAKTGGTKVAESGGSYSTNQNITLYAQCERLCRYDWILQKEEDVYDCNESNNGSIKVVCQNDGIASPWYGTCTETCVSRSTRTRLGPFYGSRSTAQTRCNNDCKNIAINECGQGQFVSGRCGTLAGTQHYTKKTYKYLCV